MLRINMLILLIFTVFLEGCGFSPLYGPDMGSGAISSIYVDNIPNREGQILRNHLMDALNSYGAPANPEMKLKVDISMSSSNFGFRQDATARRTTVTLTANFGLVDALSGKLVYQDKVLVDAAFSIGASVDTASLPQVMSEEDARNRALEQAAREIRLLVASFLRHREVGVKGTKAG